MCISFEKAGGGKGGGGAYSVINHLMIRSSSKGYL